MCTRCVPPDIGSGDDDVRLGARRRRAAEWRCIRRPSRLSRMGPSDRPATARSTARARRWHGHEHDLGALAERADYTVAGFLAEVADVQPGGSHNSQPEQADKADQSEVVGVGRVSGGVQHRFELQVAESEGGGQGGDRTAHVVPGLVISPGADSLVSGSEHSVEPR